MSPKEGISLTVIIAVVMVAVLLAAVVSIMWSAGVFISDHSVIHGIESVKWNGRTYSETYGEYELGRRIAKTTDGCDVYTIKGDSNRNFIVISSFRDTYFYVADDYTVPKSGDVTKAYWSYKQVKDERFLEAVESIIAEREAWGTYVSENGYLFFEEENQDLERLYIAYENCPAATFNAGLMGKINGRWIITVTINSEMTQCTYYPIPEKYHAILEKYF